MSSSNKLYIHHMPAEIPYDPLRLKYDKAHEAHSFVVAFLQLFFVCHSQAGINIIDTGGVSRLPVGHSQNLRVNGGVGSTDLGIITGSNSTPPTPSDYKIGTIIPHGAGAGALMYAAVNFSNPWIAPPNVYAAVHRNFTNTSGAPITVRELALYADGGSGATHWYFCVTHDVLATPATIQNGQTYRFIITYCTPVG